MRKDLVITRKLSHNYEKIISLLRENYLVITRKLSRNYEKIISLLREKSCNFSYIYNINGDVNARRYVDND